MRTGKQPAATALTRLQVRGLLSLEDVDLSFTPGRPTALIGANGAGKSNLYRVLWLLNRMLLSPGEFQMAIADLGFASRWLHFGSRHTNRAFVGVDILTSKGRNQYEAEWVPIAGDRFIFASERYVFLPTGSTVPRWKELGGGHVESKLMEPSASPTPRVIKELLQNIRGFQFHDTSFSGPLRQSAEVGRRRYLDQKGSNLAAVLAAIRDEEPARFRFIEDHIRLIYPSFARFEFEFAGSMLRLKWFERGRDYEFDAHQASDGTLRFMALATLLLQAPDRLPRVLLLDEPELGLHPHAIDVLGSLLVNAAEHCQLVIATQSPALLDYFDADDVFTVERRGGASHFKRLAKDELRQWLEAYEGEPGESLSSLWQRGVLGAGPSL